MQNEAPNDLTLTTSSLDTLIKQTESAVMQYMAKYDGSHDYNHIERVLGNARMLYKEETRSESESSYSWPVIHLAALTHDVGDKKYTKVSEQSDTPVYDMLLGDGADKATAERVQRIVRNVSYKHETNNPEEVEAVLESDPELAIVQDADRLDAIGAIGIARTFTYTGAQLPGSTMDESIEHFHEKLLKLEQKMKTNSGRHEAKVRSDRMKSFLQWWQEECDAARVKMT